MKCTKPELSSANLFPHATLPSGNFIVPECYQRYSKVRKAFTPAYTNVHCSAVPKREMLVFRKSSDMSTVGPLQGQLQYQQ